MEDKHKKTLASICRVLGLMLMDNRIPIEIRTTYAQLVESIKEEEDKNAK